MFLCLWRRLHWPSAPAFRYELAVYLPTSLLLQHGQCRSSSTVLLPPPLHLSPKEIQQNCFQQPSHIDSVRIRTMCMWASAHSSSVRKPPRTHSHVLWLRFSYQGGIGILNSHSWEQSTVDGATQQSRCSWLYQWLRILICRGGTENSLRDIKSNCKR
jgi:hypothetical protein